MSSNASAGPVPVTGVQSVSLQLSVPPVLDETLQKVIQEYITKLSDDDKVAFQSAPNIIEHLQEMQHNSKSVISSSLRARVEKVLQCVQNFMGSLSVFIQHHPEISSLVVGGVNCILMVSMISS